MKVQEVPQDNGMIEDYGHEVCYAVDDQGKYVLAPSLGWEPKNIVNELAWDLIHQKTKETIEQIHNGKLSTLAFHMANNQMDVKLLAKYVHLPRRKVKRHLKPEGFKALETDLLQRYADIFNISVDQLSIIPDRIFFHGSKELK
jgi:hypothetical protein